MSVRTYWAVPSFLAKNALFIFFLSFFFQAMNKYGVKLSGPAGGTRRLKLSGPELLCQLKRKVEVLSLTSDLHPFSMLPWAPQLPAQQLTSELGPLKSCAVVSSAGSLRHSGLGKEIGDESHTSTSVLRFWNQLPPLWKGFTSSCSASCFWWGGS